MIVFKPGMLWPVFTSVFLKFSLESWYMCVASTEAINTYTCEMNPCKTISTYIFWLLMDVRQGEEKGLSKSIILYCWAMIHIWTASLLCIYRVGVKSEIVCEQCTFCQTWSQLLIFDFLYAAPGFYKVIHQQFFFAIGFVWLLY